MRLKAYARLLVYSLIQNSFYFENNSAKRSELALRPIKRSLLILKKDLGYHSKFHGGY